MSVRGTLRQVRARLRQHRVKFAVLVGVLGGVLSTLSPDVSTVAGAVLLAAIAACAGVLVLVDLASPDGATVATPQPPRPRRQPPGPGGEAKRPARQPSDRRWLRWWRRRRTPSTVPPGDGLFQGRERELTELIARHDRQRELRPIRPARGRASRRSPVATGPVLVMIHGMLGVGKSAVAEELVRRLSGRYPDGQVLANLGSAGAARTPAEVLKDFLLALGWSGDEMPDDMIGRARIFRSLTAGKRMLFVLDAARHADQVRHLLPSSTSSAVIVTSRRDLSGDAELFSLSGGQSYLLDVPRTGEAVEIFRAVSQTRPGTRPECAVEIVQLCDRLPVAIRAAAERVCHDRTDICNVAGLLRPPGFRLQWLERPGRPVATLIQSEYDRLLVEEQDALALLALVGSPTFVPWVLVPLLGLPVTERAQAEALVDRLSAVHLLENRGADEISGVARYGFHELVLRFAEARLRELPTDTREKARRRLDEAYTEFTAAALDELDRRRGATASGRPAARFWIPFDSELPDLIADLPERWVRAEYPNLLRVVWAAAGHDNTLCWRVAATLDGCVPADGDIERTLSGYARAVSAAEAEGHQLGVVDVLLAKGTFLAAIERYPQALQCLQDAAQRARKVWVVDRAAAQAALRREATAHRKIGEAYRQAAAYRSAVASLAVAADHATLAHTLATDQPERAGATDADRAAAAEASDERQLIQLLTAEVHQVDSPEPLYDRLVEGHLTDGTRYRLRLALAEAARRRGERQSALDHLHRARESVAGDLRREATVQYHLSRVQLEPEPGDLDRAVRHAATAVLIFQRMGNDAGIVRARCLLARALLACDNRVEAGHVVRAAERDIALIQAGIGAEAAAPLSARVARANGELAMHLGHPAEADRLLQEAEAIFTQNDDWAQVAEVQRVRAQLAVPALAPV